MIATFASKKGLRKKSSNAALLKSRIVKRPKRARLARSLPLHHLEPDNRVRKW